MLRYPKTNVHARYMPDGIIEVAYRFDGDIYRCRTLDEARRTVRMLVGRSADEVTINRFLRAVMRGESD